MTTVTIIDRRVQTLTVKSKGPKGDTGDPGTNGTDGSDGADGADGLTVLNGTGAPGSGLGADGDFYIDTSAWDIYGPKASGAWPSGVSLVGPQGDKGDKGDKGDPGTNGNDGADGRTLLSGSGAPASGLGSDGDFYIDLAASQIYGPKASGSWGSGTSIIGPQGNKGDKGDQGDPGTDGADGAALNPVGAWLTATAYAVRDLVSNNGNSYVCISAHTSGAADDEPGVGADTDTYWMVSATGGGGGGGGAPSGYTELAASGDLSAAIAAQAATWLAGNPATITAGITLSRDTQLYLAPGVQLSASSAVSTLFTLGAYKLKIICGGNNSITTAAAAVFNAWDTASDEGRIEIVGELKIMASTSPLIQAKAPGKIDRLVMTVNNSMAVSDADRSLGLEIDHLEAIGLGSASSVVVGLGANVALCSMRGTFTTASISAPDSSFAISILGQVRRLVTKCSASHIATVSGHLGRASSFAAGALYLANAAGSYVGVIDGAFGVSVYPIIRADLGDYSQKFGAGYYKGLSLISGATRAEFHGAEFNAAQTITGDLSDSSFHGGRFLDLTLNSATFIRNSFHGTFFDGTFTWTAAVGLTFHGCNFEGALTIPDGAKSRLVGCTVSGALTNNDPNTEIIGCFDSSGNAIPDQVRVFKGGGAALKRFERSLRGCCLLDDPASSTEAAPIRPGMPALAVSGTVTFGSTAIVPGHTSATLTDAGNSILYGGRQLTGPKPKDNFCVAFWMNTSTNVTTGRGWWGWGNPSSSTSRVLLRYDASSLEIEILDGNTTLATYVLPTSWAADLGDGSNHHIAFGRAGTTWTLYIDGVAVGTSTATQAQDASNADFSSAPDANPPDANYAQVCVFGAGPDDTAIDQLWNDGEPLKLAA